MTDKSHKEERLEQLVQRLKANLEDAEIRLLLARTRRLNAMPQEEFLKR